MSQQYDNRGKFTLGRNKRKKSDTHADYTGTLTLLDGTECFLDAWLKTNNQTGEKFFSGKYKPKDAQAHAGPDDNGEEPQDTGDAPF